MSRSYQKPILLGTAFLILASCFVLAWSYSARVYDTWRPWIAALNVGQGDAILFSCERGEQWLVDGGPDASVLYQLGKVMPPWDRTIEWVVLTHPHADHASGLVDVLERYRVKYVLFLPSSHTTSTMDTFTQAVIASGAEVIHPVRGWTSPRPCATVLSSPSTAEDPNEQSIVLQVNIGVWTWLLTGDATEENERMLLTQGMEKVDGLKVGHHGSRWSSSEIWLDALRPRWALVSAGKKNKYGHPHSETLARLAERSVATYRTDQQGLVLFWGDALTPEWHRDIDRWAWPFWMYVIKNAL